MQLETASRIRLLPPYLFAEIDRKIVRARAAGVDVISLGIGDPDTPTPEPVVEKMAEEVRKPANHRYPSYEGLPAFREAVAGWYRQRFNVEVDQRTEVVSLIGSKEGIAHISLCFVDPGDINLIPDPSYPVYGIGTLFAGGEGHLVPLRQENGFLPRLEDIPGDVARRAKLFFLNYPNNPTAACATLNFFREVVSFAREFDIIICHDAAYSEITFDGYRAPSFLETPGAKDVGIEFHSLSKTFNMTGWRLGWAVGNPFVIEALGRLKTNIDSGVFQAIQYAGITALSGLEEYVQKVRYLYKSRRDLVVDALNELGWRVDRPLGSIYVWAPVPEGQTSAGFAEFLLEKAGVVVTPGTGYGPNGEGFFRISLSVPTDRLKQAMRRISEAGVRFSQRPS